MQVHGDLAATGVTQAVTTRRRPPRLVALVGAWAALLVVAIVVGVLYRRGKPIEVGAVPWVGRWGFAPQLVPRLIAAALVLAVATWWAPRLALRGSVARVVIAAAVTTAVLTLVLAWAGPDDTHWISLRFGYGAHTHLVDDWHGPASFLRHYVERQPHLTAHLRAHPPGLVLALWAFERVGLASRSFHLVLMLTAGSVATIAALMTMRAVAGDTWLRAAAPFVAVGPVLVWRTNPDVIFAAVGLVSIWLIVLSATSASRARRMACGVLGGVVFGLTLLLSYGLVLLALPVVAVAWRRRVVEPMLWAAAATLVVVALPALWGFSWIEGLFETRIQYAQSIAHVRGYRYWLLGNAAIYAALLGPAVFAAVTRVRGHAMEPVVLGGLSCAIAAGLSGLSSAETERIWQPFVPLVLLAGASLWYRGGDFDVSRGRRWLALQAAVALGFQAVLWTRV